MLTKNTTIPVHCAQCRREFYTPLYRLLNGRGRFCGRTCYWAHKRTVRRPLADRFWEKVDKHPGRWWNGAECWYWTGIPNPKGYGRISVHGRAGHDAFAHRVAWELTYRLVPGGLWVLHHCDTPACVRPEHLFLGTAADNTADMMAKGRHVNGVAPLERRARGERHGSRTKPESTPRGEKHTAAKLTDAQVCELRRRWSAGGIQQKALAAEYSVSRGVVSEILSGKSWKHLL
jgi:hypothetical protein